MEGRSDILHRSQGCWCSHSLSRNAAIGGSVGSVAGDPELVMPCADLQSSDKVKSVEDKWGAQE